MKQGPQYRIQLVDEATIVERGERVRVWFLPLNDGWVRAKDHPLAQTEEASTDNRDPRCPPGVIWRRSIELLLPPKTHLLSRVTRPLIQKLGTMDYLTQSKYKMQRHVKESWFVLIGNYRLRSSQEPEKFAHDRKAHHAANAPR